MGGHTRILTDNAKKPLPPLRYVGVMWLFFLIAPLALIGIGFGEHQRPNINTRVQKRLDAKEV